MVLRYVADEVAVYADDIGVSSGRGRTRECWGAAHKEGIQQRQSRGLAVAGCSPVDSPSPRPPCPPCLQGEAKRLLLASLTRSLSEVLPFLERALEGSFSAAGAAVASGNRAAAQQHVAVIQAALAAATTYSEWVPVGRLKDAGLVNACGFLLNTTEFRDAACDVLRQVAGACVRC